MRAIQERKKLSIWTLAHAFKARSPHDPRLPYRARAPLLFSALPDSRSRSNCPPIPLPPPPSATASRPANLV